MGLLRLGSKGSFLRTSFLLTVGTGVAQGIPIVFYPILSRLYSPSEFGVLALVVSTLTPLAHLASGGYHSSILVQPTRRAAVNMLALCLVLSLCVNILSFPIMYVLVRVGVLPASLSWPLLLAVSGCSLLFNIYTVYNEWCVRREYFTQVTVNKVVNAGASSAAKASFAVLPILQGMGLVLGELLGRLVSAGMALGDLLRRDRREFRLVNARDMVRLLRINKDYPLFFLPGIFLHSLAQSLLPFFFETSYGSETLGHFSMAMAIVVIPASVIGLALYDAYRSKASSEYLRTGSAVALYRRVFPWLALLALALSVGGYYLLPYIIPFVLGESWIMAGRLAAILVPTAMVGMVNSVFSCMWVIADKLKLGIAWQALYFATYVLPPYLSIRLGCGIETACIALACGNLLAYAVNMYATYQFSKGKCLDSNAV